MPSRGIAHGDGDQAISQRTAARIKAHKPTLVRVTNIAVWGVGQRASSASLAAGKA
jgi:hypothetical protein